MSVTADIRALADRVPRADRARAIIWMSVAAFREWRHDVPAGDDDWAGVAVGIDDTMDGTALRLERWE